MGHLPCGCDRTKAQSQGTSDGGVRVPPGHSPAERRKLAAPASCWGLETPRRSSPHPQRLVEDGIQVPFLHCRLALALLIGEEVAFHIAGAGEGRMRGEARAFWYSASRAALGAFAP